MVRALVLFTSWLSDPRCSFARAVTAATGTRYTFLSRPGDAACSLELFVRPGAPGFMPSLPGSLPVHAHTVRWPQGARCCLWNDSSKQRQSELFELVSGAVTVRVAGHDTSLSAGGTSPLLVPAGACILLSTLPLLYLFLSSLTLEQACITRCSIQALMSRQLFESRFRPLFPAITSSPRCRACCETIRHLRPPRRCFARFGRAALRSLSRRRSRFCACYCLRRRGSAATPHSLPRTCPCLIKGSTIRRAGVSSY